MNSRDCWIDSSFVAFEANYNWASRMVWLDLTWTVLLLIKLHRNEAIAVALTKDLSAVYEQFSTMQTQPLQIFIIALV